VVAIVRTQGDIVMPAQIANAITFQQVCDTLESANETSPDRRAQLRSAVVQFCELSGLAPTAIANGSTFGAAAAAASWRSAGLSKASWAALKSRVVAALTLAGVTVHLRRLFKANPEWEALLIACGGKARRGLSGLADWCSAQGIAPNDVNAELFDRYLQHRAKHSILVEPRERWHVARRAWNRCVAAKDSAFTQIPNTGSNAWRSLPLPAFPAALGVEIENWRAHMLRPNPFARVRSSDLFRSGRSYGPVAAITARQYIACLRQSASRLVEAGWRAADFASLSAFVDPRVVEAGLRRLWGERDFDQARPAMHALMTATLNLANYLEIEGERLEELKRLAKIVRCHPTGMSERNKARLRPLRDQEALTRLMRLPVVIDKRLSNVTTPTVRQAQLMQMAVLLELLLHVPMRVKNAASLDLGKHFMRPNAGARRCWRLNVKKGEIKNNRAIEAELSAETSAFVDRYASVFRPALTPIQSNALFVSATGRQKGPNALAKQFSAFVRRELGLAINIHLMRHVVACAYLQASPGDYEGARQLLGHKHVATTVNFYAEAEVAASFKRLDDLVSQVRNWGAESIAATHDRGAKSLL
jgi:site-specific recombinase XerD